MKRIRADFRVAASHPALPGHFPGRPIVPGVLLLDHVIEALEEATGDSVACLREVKFRSALQPEEAAEVLCEFDGQRASFRVSVRRELETVTVAVGDFLLHASSGQTA